VERITDYCKEGPSGLLCADDRDEDLAIHKISLDLGSIATAAQKDAGLPVILACDVLVHPHDKARNDGVGQRLVVILKIQRIGIVPRYVEFFVVVQVARDEIVSRAVGELKANLEMLHHIEQSMVRVARVAARAIG